VANPNALVVHLRDGIELLHFYSGRPLCRLTLRAGEVHVDMDGDGVIDHLEAVGGIHRSGHAGAARSAEQEHHALKLPKCLAMVRSGVPPTRQLFNASICETSWTDLLRFGGNMFRSGVGAAGVAADAAHSAESDAFGAGRTHTGRGGRGFSLEGGIGLSADDADLPRSGRVGKAAAGSQAEQSQALQVAHPIVVQEPHTVGKSAKRRRFHSFFFLSSGLVSSFNHDGSRTWHTQTRATWLHSGSSGAGGALSPAAAAFRPSLSPYSMHVDTPAEHVLVLGERSAALVSLGGSVRVEWTLAPDVVTANPVIADFNNDGECMNDIERRLCARSYAAEAFLSLHIHDFRALRPVLLLHVQVSTTSCCSPPRAIMATL
jgi:hypothetical protein